jgi:ADP-ribosylglycohydrolase
MKYAMEQFRGCLLGGALGDALGRHVEFMSYDAIVRQYGPGGIQTLFSGASGMAEITDDTQMTIFTAAGILDALAHARPAEEQILLAIYDAYLHWLRTQGYRTPVHQENSLAGKWAQIEWLQIQRSPGNTCLSALASGNMGSISQPLNNSKGCGGVMRVAPIGLVFPPQQAFSIGVDAAALTHGHPSGCYSAGLLAAIIAEIVQGAKLPDAVGLACQIGAEIPSARESLDAIAHAQMLAKKEMSAATAIDTLGGGWVGEEALAIALYCCLRWPEDFAAAVIAAVNHSGDSDSTGAIAGNILGASLGIEQIPNSWLSRVEGADAISALADDLWHVRIEGS